MYRALESRQRPSNRRVSLRCFFASSGKEWEPLVRWLYVQGQNQSLIEQVCVIMVIMCGSILFKIPFYLFQERSELTCLFFWLLLCGGFLLLQLGFKRFSAELKPMLCQLLPWRRQEKTDTIKVRKLFSYCVTRGITSLFVWDNKMLMINTAILVTIQIIPIFFTLFLTCIPLSLIPLNSIY